MIAIVSGRPEEKRMIIEEAAGGARRFVAPARRSRGFEGRNRPEAGGVGGKGARGAAAFRPDRGDEGGDRLPGGGGRPAAPSDPGVGGDLSSWSGREWFVARTACPRGGGGGGGGGRG